MTKKFGFMVAAIGFVTGVFVSITSAAAAVTTFTSPTAFETALEDGFTVVDTSALKGLNTAQLSALTPGATFIGAASYVRNDGLIPHGVGFYGTANPHVGMNFDVAVNGVGVTSNLFDGGRIQIFSGLNGTGTMLGEVGFGGNSAASLFAGIIADSPIMSVIFTCDFNYDLACGLIDPTFGLSTSALAASEVPVPAAGSLFLTGMIGLSLSSKARKGRHQV